MTKDPAYSAHLFGAAAYNVYCDESGHLPNDQSSVMVLGGIWCPLARSREISLRLREIRQRHGVGTHRELKWGKVSPALLRMYLDVVDYFFDDDDLRFRALIVPDKGLLRHDDFSQDHDTWYFKMYFDLLKVIIDPGHTYNIYLDVKDTRSAAKVAKLHEVLSNNVYDFRREVVARVQTVRSHEVEQLQLADLLIGAVSAANRDGPASDAKRELVDRVKARSGYSLTRTTLLREEKFNLFVWRARPVVT
jgi:hypothetical protein